MDELTRQAVVVNGSVRTAGLLMMAPTANQSVATRPTPDPRSVHCKT